MSYRFDMTWPQFLIAFRGEGRLLEPFGSRSAILLDATDGPHGDIRRRVSLGGALLTAASPEGRVAVQALDVRARQDLATLLWLESERPRKLDAGVIALRREVELRVMSAEGDKTITLPLSSRALEAADLDPLSPQPPPTETVEEREARAAARQRATSTRITLNGSAWGNVTDSINTYQRVSGSEFTAQFKAQDEFLTPRFPDGLRGERLEMAKLAPALRDEITKLLPPGSIPNEVPIRRIVKILWTDLDPNGKPNLKELRLSALPDWPAPPTTKS